MVRIVCIYKKKLYVMDYTIKYFTNKQCLQLIEHFKHCSRRGRLFLINDQLSDTMRKKLLTLNMEVSFVPSFVACLHKDIIFHYPSNSQN